jgi:hypothetical protein
LYLYNAQGNPVAKYDQSGIAWPNLEAAFISDNEGCHLRLAAQ